MPRKKMTEQVNFTLTPEQAEALRIMMALRGMGKNEYMRTLLEHEAFMLSVEWPPSAPARGKYPRIMNDGMDK